MSDEEDVEMEKEEGEMLKKDGPWERFLWRIAHRVLLIKADDSTRQIIPVLLWKCSYEGQFFHYLSHYFLFDCFVFLISHCCCQFAFGFSIFLFS